LSGSLNSWIFAGEIGAANKQRLLVTRAIDAFDTIAINTRSGAGQ
jgi:hypothetical protein